MFEKKIIFEKRKITGNSPPGIGVYVQFSGIPGDLGSVLQFFVVTCGYSNLIVKIPCL
jgi:hypothetical protein